jgi:hypothetical protein
MITKLLPTADLILHHGLFAQISLFRDFAAPATIALESTRRERQYLEMQSEPAHANRVATMKSSSPSRRHAQTPLLHCGFWTKAQPMWRW